MTTNSIKKSYTFSGQDIRVIAYKSIETIRRLNKESDFLNGDFADGAEQYKKLTSQQKQVKAEQDAYAAAEQRALENYAAIDSQADQGDPWDVSNAGAGSRNDKISQLAQAQATANANAAKAKGAEEQGRTIRNERQALSSAARNYSADFSIEDPASTYEKFNKKLQESKPYVELGALDSFSFSSFREKVAVRTIGRSHALGYTKGARTVAGSLVFNSLQENELLSFFGDTGRELRDGNIKHLNKVMLDQIDPFNVILIFANEFGGNSIMQLFNVELNSENQRMSVHDLVIQNNINFYATDIIPMQDTGNLFSSTSDMLHGLIKADYQSRKDSSLSKIKSNIDSAAFGKEAEGLLNRSRGLF